MEKNPFEEDLKGIKGWLVLVAIGVVIAPIRIIGGFLMLYGPLLAQGTWRVLVTPGGDAYHPFWVPVLAFEITYNIAMGAAAIWLAILFFKHHRFFPRVYIALMVAALVGIPFDAWLVSLALPQEVMFDQATARELGRTALASAIWIPYMLTSKRVKATFIR